MPSKFVEFVPLSHRQGNCIPYAAIRWHDFGNRPALGRPLGHFSRHPDTPLLSLSPRRRFPRPTPERVFVADHQSSSGFSGTGPSAPPVPSIYSIVPPNDGSALRHGHHFEPVDFVIDHGRGHHDAYSAGSCQRTYARACGCRQRPRRHREELIESERRWSGREAFVTMMQTADLGQGNDRSGPGRLNGSSIRCVLAERQVGP